MAKRHELTDEAWALIADFFPAQGRGGQWSDHRTILNGILWRLRTGAACDAQKQPTVEEARGRPSFEEWVARYHAAP